MQFCRGEKKKDRGRTWMDGEREKRDGEGQAKGRASERERGGSVSAMTDLYSTVSV